MEAKTSGNYSPPAVSPYIQFNEQSGTTYTLQLSDGGKTILFTGSDNVCCVIPADDDVLFPTGTVVTVEQSGAGIVIIEPYDVTVTIDAYEDGRQSMGQYAYMQLVKKGDNHWTCIGGAEVTEVCGVTTTIAP